MADRGSRVPIPLSCLLSFPSHIPSRNTSLLAYLLQSCFIILSKKIENNEDSEMHCGELVLFLNLPSF